MKVTILQKDITWADAKANIADAERLIKAAPRSDLYVLPEMWTTGFATVPFDISEDIDHSISLDWMVNEAQSIHSALAGSLSVKADGKYRNRLYFVYPDGHYKYYDKHHLFKYGGEDKYYTQGEVRVVVEYDGMRFLLATCFDLRFPEWLRNFNDYDCILLVANWPESRQNAWQILLRARAIENQCYVVGANRVGDDEFCHYIGNSAVIDAYGHTIGRCTRQTNTTVTCDISMEELNHFRNRFNIIKDRDNYTFDKIII